MSKGTGATGIESEHIFRKNLPGSYKNPIGKKSDIIWPKNGYNIHCESKGPINKNSKTKSGHLKLNQDRPIKKNITLANVSHLEIYKEKCDCLVYSLPTLLKDSLIRPGQHTPDAVACLSFDTCESHIDKFGCFSRNL